MIASGSPKTVARPFVKTDFMFLLIYFGFFRIPFKFHLLDAILIYGNSLIVDSRSLFLLLVSRRHRTRLG